MIRKYSELRRLETFSERYEYLKLGALVGEQTFGWDRWINQKFYASREWKHIRNHVIARDMGCDLGMPGYEQAGRLYIHHMNPMTAEHIQEGSDLILDPEFLISCTLRTHNAIHYGSADSLAKQWTPRRRGDTKSW